MKKELIRLTALCLALCLGICVFPARAAATGGVVEEDGDISIPINPGAGKEEPPEEYVAQGFCGEEALWILNDQGLLLISGDGAMFNYETPGSAPWYDYRDEIKEVVVDGDVSSVTAGAFYDCANLETVSLGNGVTAVDGAAFIGCAALKSILVDSDNAAFTNDAAGALYSKDKTVLVRCPTGYAGSFAVPAGVTEIGENAFLGCEKLKAVTVPATVAQIGAQAFEGCPALGSIQVDADNAVYASDDRGVLFNKAMTSLLRAPQALSGHYLVPETVTAVEQEAFSDCTALTGITIQTGVAQIGEAAFSGCSALAKVRYCAAREQWEQIVIGSQNEPLANAQFEYDAQPYIPGDFDANGEVSDADALYLLRYTLFPDRYPIEQPGDVNGDNEVSDADALYLLRHTLFPSRYPLS